MKNVTTYQRHLKMSHLSVDLAKPNLKMKVQQSLVICNIVEFLILLQYNVVIPAVEMHPQNSCNMLLLLLFAPNVKGE